jgi:hypothetical protein
MTPNAKILAVVATLKTFSDRKSPGKDLHDSSLAVLVADPRFLKLRRTQTGVDTPEFLPAHFISTSLT